MPGSVRSLRPLRLRVSASLRLIPVAALRLKGAAFLCGATVNLHIGPEAREKRRQAARSPKAGATPGATTLLIHWTHFQSHPASEAQCREHLTR